MNANATLTLRFDDWHLLAEALEPEIQLTTQAIQETADEETRLTEAKRLGRLEGIREYILSATYTPGGRA